MANEGDIQAEAVVAVLGVAPFLREGDKPIRLTQKARENAIWLARRWDTAVRRFIRGGETFEVDQELPQVDMDSVDEDLAREITVDELAAKIAGLTEEDDDLALRVAVVALRAIEYLRTVIPRRSRNTALGAKPIPASEMERQKFRRAYSAIENPGIVLDEISEGALTHDQVRAMSTVYPALYLVIHKLVAKQMVELVADKPDAEFPRARDKQLAVLLQATTWTPELAKRLQEAHAMPDPTAPQGGGGGGGGGKSVAADALMSQTQKLESRG